MTNLMVNEREMNPEEDVASLLAEIANTKSILVDRILRQYEKFEHLNIEISDIATSFEKVHEKCEEIIDRSVKVSEILFQSIEDKEKYEKQIDNLRSMKDTVKGLIELNRRIYNLRLFSRGEVREDEHLFEDINAEIKAVNDALNHASGLRWKEMRAHKALLTSLADAQIDLSEKIGQIWESNVTINRNTVNPFCDKVRSLSIGQTATPLQCISLEITLSSSVLGSLIHLMHNLNISFTKLQLLLGFIMKEIIFPAIDNWKTSSFHVKIQSDKFILLIIAEKTDQEPSVFIENLTEVLKSLYDYLLSISISDPQVTILKWFQQEYFDLSFTEHLISSFLNELKLNESTILALQNFIEFLRQYNFISSSNQSLNDFVENSEKRARENDVTLYLNDARRWFSESILECEISSRQDPILHSLDNDALAADIAEEMSQLTFLELNQVSFPSCKVSAMVMNAVNSIVDMINLFESKISDDMRPSSLLEMTDFLRMFPEMMSMYIYIVPITNKEVLEQLPLASVLHFNNCMYLAHCCMFWSTMIKPLIDAVRQHKSRELNYSDDAVYQVPPYNLLPLVYQYRNAASECLSRETHKQKSIISEFFDDIVSFSGIGAENKERVYKTMKKCHHHLSLLSKVYNRFPVQIFDSVFGSLCDWTTDHILKKILTIPDIIKSDNEQLVVLLNEYKDQITDIIGKCLQERQSRIDESGDNENLFDEASTYLLDNCPKWRKLQEILFILDNCLTDIEKRWLDNRVAMSEQISAVEVRNMIKALFKNNNLRSKVLDKII